MGYALNAPSAYTHLTEKVAQAVTKIAEGQLGGPNQTMAEAIIQNHARSIAAITLFLQSTAGVTVESTDAAIDAAIATPSALNFMKAFYGIP